MNDNKATKISEQPLFEAQSMRNMYVGVDRTEVVSKLTTRVPHALRAQMKAIASYPPFGYRSQVQMYSHCLVEFLRDRPWERGLKFRASSQANSETPLFHLHLEPVDVGTQLVTGQELKSRALELAEEAGTNQAGFALTFLWWIALHKHPFPDQALMENLMRTPGALS